MMCSPWGQTDLPGPATISATGKLPCRTAGLTLFEVVIALSILVLLIGLAAISFSSVDQEQTLKRPGHEIQKLAERARRTAMRDGRPYTLELRGASIVVGGEEWDLPKDMRLEISPWGSDKWSKAGSYFWRFEPNGLCEPLGIRVCQGEAHYAMRFHPLTAAVESEELWIP